MKRSHDGTPRWPRPCVAADLPQREALITIKGDAKHVIEIGRTRLVVTAFLFLICFGAIILRLGDLMLIRGGRDASVSPEPGKYLAAINAMPALTRADIVDRNGVILAVNLPVTSAYADPRQIFNADQAAAELAHVLPGLDQKRLARRLSGGNSFVWVARNLTPRQEYRVNALGIPGVYFLKGQHRVYPQGAFAGAVLGYTSVDNRGLAGIEKEFNRRLINPALTREPLVLSIDARVQYAMRTFLLRNMKTYQAIGAVGLVMNVHTGEILAMVSLPDFDPNHPGASPTTNLFNRATLGVYEPGSTFKTFTMAMALNDGVATLRDGEDASHPIHIARFTIRDFDPENRWLSLPEIYEYSSNIGAAKLALQVGAARQEAFLRTVGMFAPSPIQLPAVAPPLLPRRWTNITTMTVAFGDGIAVTPIQLVTGIAAMVNGGMYVAPTLLKIWPGQAVTERRVISPTTSRDIRKIMNLVVQGGTGIYARAPGYLVGGKTGTSEVVGPNGRYIRNSVISSFVGVFPINDPRYAVYAMLDQPKGTPATHGFATGGYVAAPVVSEVIRTCAPFLGVAPQNPKDPAIVAALALPPPHREREFASR